MPGRRVTLYRLAPLAEPVAPLVLLVMAWLLS